MGRIHSQSKEWDTFVADIDAARSLAQQKSGQERYLGSVLTKTDVLLQMFKFRGIKSHPDNYETGSEEHALLKKYLGLRKVYPAEQAYAFLTENPQGKSGAKISRDHFWATTRKLDENQKYCEVTAAAERFIAREPSWQRGIFETTRTTEVKSQSDAPAGFLSYKFDILVGSTPYEFKFSDKFFDPKIAEITIALMMLVSKGEILNFNPLSYDPKACLVFPHGVQFATFPKQGHQIRQEIINSCLLLLQATFVQNPGQEKLVSTRRKVTDKNKKDEPSEEVKQTHGQMKLWPF